MGQRQKRTSTVTSSAGTTIPAAIRRQANISPGDQLVWENKGTEVRVRVQRRQRRAFDDFAPFDFGDTTDATADHDLVY